MENEEREDALKILSLFVPNVTWAGMKSKAQCLSIYNRGQSISTVDAFMARQKTFAAP
jgi:hypothetical protein